LYSRLLSKNIKIRIYKTTVLPVVCMGVKLGLLTIREEHRLRVFEKSVLGRISGRKGCEIMRSFITCTIPQVELE
jgi:hypothetical protein